MTLDYRYDATGKSELELAALCLYWGEGSRSETRKVVLTNSDARMIELFARFLCEICNVPQSELRMKIQLHDPTLKDQAIQFWSKRTGCSDDRILVVPKKSKGGKSKYPMGIASLVINSRSLTDTIREKLSLVSSNIP